MCFWPAYLYSKQLGYHFAFQVGSISYAPGVLFLDFWNMGPRCGCKFATSFMVLLLL